MGLSMPIRDSRKHSYSATTTGSLITGSLYHALSVPLRKEVYTGLKRESVIPNTTYVTSDHLCDERVLHLHSNTLVASSTGPGNAGYSKRI